MSRYAVTFGKTHRWFSELKKNISSDRVFLFFLPAGLRLLARHASQFSSCLMDHYRVLFETMCKLCGHINGEMKKTSYLALEAFLKQVRTSAPDWPAGSWPSVLFIYFLFFGQVALLVAENIEEHKTKLKFFMQKFCGIIKTMDSTHKELSIAIRGYGFFAAVS